ncbi:MAG: peptidyl-prolyl cis-trans isomerase, partial [Candidatus Cloacimonetes bacterium]|nr:peptidyl-prolyl cis-trans isomerase [Candidatus Cloacimonadota bacterium]
MTCKKNLVNSAPLFCLIIFLLMIGLSSCALQTTNVAGRVNGHLIKTPDFNAAHRGHFENFMFENGRVPDSEEKKEIHRLTWRDITIHYILMDYFKKFNISSSESETLDTLMTNPPAYILKSPLFVQDGKFDRDKYRLSLLYDDPVNLRPLKRDYYEYKIPIQKLKLKLVENVLLSRKEAKSIALIAASSADIDWYVFNPDDIKPIVSEEDVRAYYQENQQQFSLTPSFSVEYISLPVDPTGQDLSYSKTKIDSLYAELQQGRDFGQLASKYSHAPSARDKGNMGYVALTDLPEELHEQIQALQVNEISLPLYANGAWHIYLLKERTKSLFRLSEIKINPISGKETREQMLERANDVLQLASRFGMSRAADELDYQHKLLENIPRESPWINDPEIVSQVQSRLAHLKSGETFPPQYSEDLSAWILIRVFDVVNSTVKPYEEVKDQIFQDLAKARSLSDTKKFAQSWLERRGSSIQVEGDNRVQKAAGTRLQISDSYLDARIETVFYDALHNFQTGLPTKPYVLGKMVVVPVVKAVYPAKKPHDDKQLIYRLFINRLENKWFDNWLEAQIAA